MRRMPCAGLQGALAGAGGGLCQVSIMGPCTFLVTGAVTGDKSEGTMQRIRRTHAAKGIRVQGTVSLFPPWQPVS